MNVLRPTYENRKVILLLFIALLPLQILAQHNHKLSLGFGGGYGFGLSGKRLGADFIYTPNSTSEDGIYGTWGEGFNYYIRPEIMICPDYSTGIEFNYIDGKKFNWSTHVNGNSSSTIDLFKNHYINFSATPYLLMHPRTISRWTPYVELGMEINLYSRVRTIQEENQSGGSSMVIYHAEGTTYAKVNLGFRGAIGVKYKLNKHWALSAELNINSTTLMPDELIYDTYTINGTNQLGSLTVSQKHVEYFKKFTEININPDEPQKALASPDPAGSWGVRGGVVYGLEIRHRRK